MQKTSKKASILIWSIFLSLVLSFSFIYISTNIAKVIKNNSILGDFIHKKSDIINSIYTYGSGLINNNQNEYIIEQSNIFTLKSGEEKNFNFTGNSSFTGRLSLINGGPLYFELKSYSGNIVYSSYLTGVLSNSSQKNFTGYLDLNYSKSILYVKNIGGLSNIKLFSNSYNGNEKKYIIIKNIGGVLVEEKIVSK